MDIVPKSVLFEPIQKALKSAGCIVTESELKARIQKECRVVIANFYKEGKFFLDEYDCPIFTFQEVGIYVGRLSDTVEVHLFRNS